MNHLCPGKRSTAAQGTYGLCIRCDRLHPAGGMEPAVRRESGQAVCADWVRLRMVQSKRMSVRETQ